MKKLRHLLWLLTLTPLVFAANATIADSAEVAVVRAQVAAFNRHDPEALAALLAEKVKWFSVDADKLSVDGDGRDAIRMWLVGYFKGLPDVRSEMFDVAQNGPFISYRERASWTAKDGKPRAQQAFAVYEVREGLIIRVWYFPAVRDPASAAK